MEVTDAAGLANHRNDKDVSTEKGVEIHGIGIGVGFSTESAKVSSCFP